MNGLMIGLLAGALVSFGGRWWLLGRAIAERIGQARTLPAMLLSAVLVAAAAAWLGGTVSREVRGPGLLLFLALSLLLAGAGALWPTRAIPPRLQQSARGPVSAFILLLAAQISESAPFIILATAAWSLDPLMAGVGGALGVAIAGSSIGLLTATELAAMPVRRLRIVIGAMLLIIGLWLALAALAIV